MLNSEQEVQVCDARDDDSSIAAGYKIKIPFLNGSIFFAIFLS